MPSKEKIYELLENLRVPNGDKVRFADYLEDAWYLFKFDDNADLPSFEAFLINAVSICFNKAEHDENQAKSRDACLVGLGLLKGCYHTKTEDDVFTHISVNDRYISYLQGDYIELMRPNYNKDDNLDPTSERSKPRQAVAQSDKRVRAKLAVHLASSGYMNGYQTCLQAGIEKYTVLANTETSDSHNARQIVLPEPYFTLENFSPKDSSSLPRSEEEPEPILEPSDALTTPKQPNSPDGQSDESDDGKGDKKGQNALINGLEKLLSLIFDNWGKFCALCVFLITVAALWIAVILISMYKPNPDTPLGVPDENPTMQGDGWKPGSSYTSPFAGENNIIIIINNNNHYYSP